VKVAVRLVRIAVVTLLLIPISFGQSGAVIPQGGAGHADVASCVILKRMGPADQVTSRLYSFGIRGKQFQYVEGKLPEGFPFHGRLTDHDVRNLQGRGAEVIVLNQNFTTEDLDKARADCREETGKTPIQAESKVQLVITSTPDAADIEIDSSFVGNTPSTVGVAAGQHQISVKKSGFKHWERKIAVSSGQVNVNAVLEVEAK
jgi:PEGA domain